MANTDVFSIYGVRGMLRAGVLLVAMLGTLVVAAPSQQPMQSDRLMPSQDESTFRPPVVASDSLITPSFKDADITQIVAEVSDATGKNFIIDPRVRAKVTMLSSTPMSPPAFYEAFLAILQVHGFIAVESEDVIKIVPDSNARQFPGRDLSNHIGATSDEIMTQIIVVNNVSAAQIVPVLRPLMPQYGQLAAVPASNMLIVSDRANNVNRIRRIIDRIDEVGDSEIDVIQLQNASAADVERVLNLLGQAPQNAEGGGRLLKVVADERSNSVLLKRQR